jgi:colanic acid/amylovoran biosynthesis glycosyltransferase
MEFEEKQKPVVAHSVHCWLPRTENWIWNQVRFLPREIETHILCEMTENREEYMVPNIHCFGQAPRWQRRWDTGLRRLGIRQHAGFLSAACKKHSIELLHSHFGHVGWANMGLAQRNRLKHVVTFYGFDVSYLPAVDPIWRQRYEELFRKIDLVFCEGPHMADCVAGLGCPEEKVKVHHLGIPVEDIAFQARQLPARDPLRVLIAASFQEKKGIPCAIEALGILQRGVPLEITIIGDANQESRSLEEKQRILATIDRHGLRARTRLLGYQPHAVLLEESYRHHIFLSPSITASDGDTEGGAPVAIIEMAASGMPVVSTRHCDIPEVFPVELRPRLACERDVAGLLAALRSWLENPTRWMLDLQACRKHIETEYDAKTQGKRLGETYLRLVQA